MLRKRNVFACVILIAIAVIMIIASPKEKAMEAQKEQEHVKTKSDNIEIRNDLKNKWCEPIAKKAEVFEVVEIKETVAVEYALAEVREVEEEEIDEQRYESLGVFRLTAYCSCEKCCGKYAENRPIDEYGKEIVITSSGKRAVQGRTIAVDKKLIPFGTKVMIDGVEYEAMDEGSGINDKCIDIYFENHEEAVKFGMKHKEVFICR